MNQSFKGSRSGTESIVMKHTFPHHESLGPVYYAELPGPRTATGLRLLDLPLQRGIWLVKKASGHSSSAVSGWLRTLGLIFNVQVRIGKLFYGRKRLLGCFGSGAIPRKCMFFTGDWFSGLYAAKSADQSSGAVTIFSVSGLMLN